MAIQPPQRFELDDLTHVEREARTIYAPGATPGDVLVVQSDHSLVAAPGGGSPPAKLGTLSAADIHAGNLIELAPTPGPGRVAVPTLLVFVYRFVSTPYMGGANWRLSWGAGGRALDSVAVAAAGTEDQIAGVGDFFATEAIGGLPGQTSLNLSGAEDTPVTFGADGDATGDGTFDVYGTIAVVTL